MDDNRSNLELRLLQLCWRIIECGGRDIAASQASTAEAGNHLELVFEKLEALIKIVSVGDAEEMLRDPRITELIPRIRAIRAQYEFEQEMALSQRLLSSDLTGLKLAEMITTPYQGSAIYHAEFQRKIKGLKKPCLIVGSGPLPATALLFLSRGNMDITCLDISPESNVISKQIFASIGVYPSIQHVTSDILEWDDFSDFGLIFINGLVGVGADGDAESIKSSILDHILKNKGKGGMIVFRSGHGLAHLFYPRVDADKMTNLSTTAFPPLSPGRSSIVCLETSVARALGTEEVS